METQHSPHTADPYRGLTPFQRQEVQAATAPVARLDKADSELRRLTERASQIRAGLTSARKTFENDSYVPEGLRNDASDEIRRAAETAISTVEAELRRDLAILSARVQVISRQLVETSEHPALSSIEPDVIDGANRFAPLIGASLDGMPLAQIASRAKAAQLRGDQSELLALAMVVRPIVADRKATISFDDPEFTDLAKVEDVLHAINERFRDTSLDPEIERARKVAAGHSDLDHGNVKARSERTGDRDPYIFLGRN